MNSRRSGHVARGLLLVSLAMALVCLALLSFSAWQSFTARHAALIMTPELLKEIKRQGIEGVGPVQQDTNLEDIRSGDLFDMPDVVVVKASSLILILPLLFFLTGYFVDKITARKALGMTAAVSNMILYLLLLGCVIMCRICGTDIAY